MIAQLNPKTGSTIGYQETKGTVAEPFIVPMAWQTSSLSYVALALDSTGALMVAGAGGGGGGHVTVDNFPATQPISAAALPLPAGAATDASISAGNPYRGTSTYFGGSAGTVAVPTGARVVSLSAHSTGGGSVAVFGGQSVPIPAGNGFSDGWSGFIGPGNIVFTGTDSYYVAINQ